MSENNEIESGDMVEVVKPTLCCGSTLNIGKKFRVIYVGKDVRLGECQTCGEILPNTYILAYMWGGLTCEIERLKKIGGESIKPKEVKIERFA